MRAPWRHKTERCKDYPPKIWSTAAGKIIFIVHDFRNYIHAK